jgi:choline-glycine betaine transporter
MLVSDLITALKDLATLIGLPFFTVLMGFFILAVELFVLGRKEMINLNRKMDQLVRLSEKKPEKESEEESKKEPRKVPEEEPEKEAEKEPEKKKFRYKWK